MVEIISNNSHFSNAYKPNKHNANVKVNHSLVSDKLLQFGPTNFDAITNNVKPIPPWQNPITVLKNMNKPTLLTNNALINPDSSKTVHDGNKTVFLPNLEIYYQARLQCCY